MVALRELEARGGRAINTMLGNPWHVNEERVAHAFAIEALGNGWKTHGSGTTNPQELIETPDWLETVRNRSVRGGRDLDRQVRSEMLSPDKLAAFDKFWILFLDSLRPNIDIFAKANLDDYGQNIELIRSLLLYGHMRWGDVGGDMIASTSRYFGRMPMITRFLDPNRPQTEINLIVLPKIMDDGFVDASTFRARTVSPLSWSVMGSHIERDGEESKLRPDTLRKQRTVSDYLIQVSRTVRGMILAGLAPIGMDIEAVIRACPRDCKTEIPNLEAVVTFAANMMLAEMKNPKLTNEYLDALRFNKFLNKNKAKSIALALKNTELSLYGGVADGWNMSSLAELMSKYLVVDQSLLPLLFEGITLQPRGQVVQAGKLNKKVVDKARDAYAVAAELMYSDSRFLNEQRGIVKDQTRILC